MGVTDTGILAHHYIGKGGGGGSDRLNGAFIKEALTKDKVLTGSYRDRRPEYRKSSCTKLAKRRHQKSLWLKND